MPDILTSAQTQINNAATQPLLKDEALLPKTVNVPDPILEKLDLPFSSHTKESSDEQKTPITPSDPTKSSPIPPPVKRRHYKPALVALLFFLLVTIPLGAYFVSQQKQLTDTRSKAAYVTSENKLYIANLDKTSFSVVWKESLPSKGCATAINTKTKKESKQCDTSLSTMHLVTLTGLDPYLTHTVSAQGAQKVLLHPFFGDGVITGLFDETKPSSRLSKGTVATQKGQPFQGGFVIVTPVLTNRFYFPVADETDPKGQYQIDLSLITAQNPGPFDAYLVEVVDRMGKTLVEEKIQVGSISASLIPTITVNTQ